MLARALGAGRVITTDVNAYRLQAAKRFGADAAIDAHEDVAARLRALNDGRLADLVIACVGVLPVFEQALRCVDRGGTVLFFAPTDEGVHLSVPVNEFWRNGITLMPSYGNSPLDAVQAIELLRAGRVRPDPMITHRVALDETGKGFRLVSDAGASLKVIVEPRRSS
jgi:L-iditol 2-dehydrogenase